MEQIISSPIKSSEFNEHRWLEQVQHHFSKDLEEALRIKVSVFDVPKHLREGKPDAYVPHFFAVGPYHQHRVELRCMEWYKITAAKSAKRAFKDMKFHDLMNEFKQLESDIRAPYNRYLDFTEESLAWMIAIDSCFLFEFLPNSHNGEGKGIVPPPTNWISGILKDILMLENQVLLVFLLRKTLEFKYSPKEIAATKLQTILEKFIKEVTPLTVTVNIANLDKYAHVLELLYHVIVPNLEEKPDQTKVDIENHNETQTPRNSDNKRSV